MGERGRGGLGEQGLLRTRSQRSRQEPSWRLDLSSCGWRPQGEFRPQPAVHMVPRQPWASGNLVALEHGGEDSPRKPGKFWKRHYGTRSVLPPSRVRPLPLCWLKLVCTGGPRAHLPTAPEIPPTCYPGWQPEHRTHATGISFIVEFLKPKEKKTKAKKQRGSHADKYTLEVSENESQGRERKEKMSKPWCLAAHALWASVLPPHLPSAALEQDPQFREPLSCSLRPAAPGNQEPGAGKWEPLRGFPPSSEGSPWWQGALLQHRQPEPSAIFPMPGSTPWGCRCKERWGPATGLTAVSCVQGLQWLPE